MKDNILLQAKAQRYAIGAFNVNTYDEMVAIAETSEKYALPVIMMASMSSAEFFGTRTFVRLCQALDEKCSIPIISHLDHCTKPDLLLECVRAGFDSVMYDGSHSSYRDNVAVTRLLAEQCHQAGVFLEAELGVIAGEEGPVKSKHSEFTDPDYVLDFIGNTGVDALAVSIGNAHGFYKGKPEIQFGLLQQIARNIPDTPLVLHGGTGIPAEDIRRAIGLGIAKVNVGSEIRATYARSIADYAKSHEIGDVRDFVCFLRAELRAAADKYINCFDCRES